MSTHGLFESSTVTLTNHGKWKICIPGTPSQVDTTRGRCCICSPCQHCPMMLNIGPTTWKGQLLFHGLCMYICTYVIKRECDIQFQHGDTYVRTYLFTTGMSVLMGECLWSLRSEGLWSFAGEPAGGRSAGGMPMRSGITGDFLHCSYVCMYVCTRFVHVQMYMH